MAVGTAAADSGTFSGTITPTDCGPLQPVNVAPGDTTIVGAAAMTVSANDITLELYDPSGTLKVDGDTATSPETVRYQSPNLQAGTWNLQVCPFSGGLIAAPYSLHGHVRDEQRPGRRRSRRHRLGNRRHRRDADAHLRRGQARRSARRPWSTRSAPRASR